MPVLDRFRIMAQRAYVHISRTVFFPICIFHHSNTLINIVVGDKADKVAIGYGT